MITHEAFDDAARTFAELVRQVPDERWSGPGLGEWDLRALVGHTSRSLLTVESYLAQPVEVADVPSPAAYLARIDAAGNPAITERGRAAGAALGPDPAAAVAAIVERVLPLVDRDDDPLMTTAAGGMRLSTYLPTRTFELVVHGFDIASALGVQPPGYPEATLTEVAAVAAEAAVLRGHGGELVLALTGRAELPAGFSVV